MARLNASRHTCQPGVRPDICFTYLAIVRNDSLCTVCRMMTFCTVRGASPLGCLVSRTSTMAAASGDGASVETKQLPTKIDSWAQLART